MLPSLLSSSRIVTYDEKILSRRALAIEEKVIVRFCGSNYRGGRNHGSQDVCKAHIDWERRFVSERHGRGRHRRRSQTAASSADRGSRSAARKTLAARNAGI